MLAAQINDIRVDAALEHVRALTITVPRVIQLPATCLPPRAAPEIASELNSDFAFQQFII